MEPSMNQDSPVGITRDRNPQREHVLPFSGLGFVFPRLAEAACGAVPPALPNRMERLRPVNGPDKA